MAFTNVVDTITLEDIVPQVVDTVLRANTFATRMLSKTKRFQAATQDFPIKFQKGTAVQSFIGFQTLPIDFTDTRVLLKYNPTFVAANVALAATDIAANNVAQKVLDLTQVEMDSRAQDLADSMGTFMYGTGSGTDPLGLGAIFDDGNSVGTIGGLSRSTYTTLASTVTSLSSSSLSLSAMRTLYNAISDASVVPTRSYTDYATWQLYEALLLPQARIYKEVNIAPNYKGYEGFQGLMFAGMEVVPDRKNPTSGQLFMLNENYINWYALATSMEQFEGARKVDVASKLFTGNSYNEVDSLGFYWTGFIKATNMFAFNSFIVLGGNLVTDNPRRHGKLTNITS